MKSALTVVLFPLFAVGVFADGKETNGVELESFMEGDSVTLMSGVTKIQTHDKIEWRLNGSRIVKISSGSSEIPGNTDGSFKDRLQLDKQTGDLKISNIRTTDSGQYKVKFSSPRASSEMTFTVKVVPADGVKTVTVLEGDSVTLRTDPAYTLRYDVIRWRFGQQNSTVAGKTVNVFTSNGSDEIFRDRLWQDNQTGSLIITNITATDSGLYEAEISSSRYTIHKSFDVTVRDDVESVSVLEGDNVTLHTGLTDIQTGDEILWKFGDHDKLIADLNETWGNIDLNSQTRNLTISNIQRGQSGHYKVEIITRRMILHRKYRITIGEMKSVSGMEGDSVTLQTVTEIQNDDLIHWMFGDNVVAEIHKAGRRFYTSDVPDERFSGRLKLDRQTGSLTITNTRTTDSGEYQLKISSSRCTINRRVSVTVTGEMKSVSGMEGDSVTLQTVTEIQNDDLIHWMFGDNVVAEIHKAGRRFYTSDVPDERFSGRLKLDRQTGSLTITNTRTTDSGEYQLKISSSRCTINRRVSVTVTGSDPRSDSDPRSGSDPRSDSGLSPGAVAGIVGGVLLVAAVVAAVVVFAVVMYYRRKISELERRREENGQNLKTQATGVPANEKTELYSEESTQ